MVICLDLTSQSAGGELFALLMLALMTIGHLAVVVDASYVTKGFARGKHWVHKHHTDLWQQLWQAIDNREGKLFIYKVSSHATASQLENGDVEGWACCLNQGADRLAGKAADKYQLPETAVDLIRHIDARAWQI
jgi:hypothetical protein